MVILCITVIICVSLLSLVNSCTDGRIRNNEKEAALKLIHEVMPLDYTNDLFADFVEVSDDAYFDTRDKIYVFRARRNDEPAGLVFIPVMADGYSGKIEIAVGLSRDGTLTGVRIRKHQETEGTGDQIHQDNSDWILGFDNRSLANTTENGWAVESDGGEFDQISGATFSPRSVINTVRKTLEYYAIHEQELYVK